MPSFINDNLQKKYNYLVDNQARRSTISFWVGGPFSKMSKYPNIFLGILVRFKNTWDPEPRVLPLLRACRWITNLCSMFNRAWPTGDSDQSSDGEKSRKPLTGKRKRQTSGDEDDEDAPITPKTRRCRRSIRQRRSVDSLSVKDRNLRRLESNERERLRMHSLNDAFEVGPGNKRKILLYFFFNDDPFYEQI